ncbi:MAG: YjjG family noncanonical pyrimidine nucleotidase [Negativibacillus massiliensis]|nr:YjjG family noncanonical pyrimidine nucleotidase [Negativibacillus massiliensis]
MKYDILLIDADETLMDFPDAEHQALIRTFQAHNLPFSDETDQLYQSINQNLWREFEQNKITRQQLLATRFAKLFEALHIDLDSDAFNTEYLFNLGFGGKTLPHALDTCKQLHEMGCRLYILTNGVGATQRRRIQASGLSPFLTDIFVSEESGFQKPMKEFFDYVFARIPDFDKTRALMIGDSLSSDMEGARRAGVDACWFNPQHKPRPQDIPIHYDIDSLPRLLQIVQNGSGTK